MVPAGRRGAILRQGGGHVPPADAQRGRSRRLGGGDLLPGGGIAGIGAVNKHDPNGPRTTKLVEVGDANAAHSPLPLAFGMMIAVGASLLVFCMFSLPNGSSELAHSLRYAFRGKQAAKGRHRRLHDEV